MEIYGEGHGGRMPRYPTRQDTALKDVNGSTAVFVLREQIFCTVTSCGCVFANRRFEGMYRRPLQDCESDGLITLKRKAV
jgi:hypothetical protein